MNLPPEPDFENHPSRPKAIPGEPIRKTDRQPASSEHDYIETQNFQSQKLTADDISAAFPTEHDDSQTTRPSLTSPSSNDSEPTYPTARRKIHVTPQPNDGFFGRMVWLCAAAAFVLILWHVGPEIVERYQFAKTRGEIRAKYENAVKELKNQPLNSVSMAYQLVAQKVKPSVVSIRAIREAQPDKRSWGGANQTRQGYEKGQGSGVIMSSDGFILTNAHVVKDAKAIEIVLHDRRSFMAEQVGKSDQPNDLAVLKIDAPDLVPADWGDSDELEVGSIVWAIGSPYGLEQSVTSGIVSAKNRFDENNPQQSLLQTDAAVNPGNSGGPLVNSEGKVVGINTAIYGDKFQGISFAVPSAVAKWVYEQITSKGFVNRGRLGVRPAPVFQRDADRLSLPDIDGALIQFVEDKSPSALAGLKPNDVIRKWDGQSITTYSNLYRYVAMTEPDETIKVELIREGQRYEVDVTPESYLEYGKRLGQIREKALQQRQRYIEPSRR